MAQASADVGALLAAARAGDRAARDRLFADCRDYLCLAARARVESWLRAKADASDLVQQTLLEAHRGFGQFHGETEAEFLAWLRRILDHNAADLVRRYHAAGKRQVGREVPLAGGGSTSGGGLEPAATDDSPSATVAKREGELALAAALAELAPDHREVIMLRNLQRLPFDEVAGRMNRSRPAAQMLWMRAMQKLKDVLGAES
jgi:RNA polymerase sigma-70 factor (ECF subfamily)